MDVTQNQPELTCLKNRTLYFGSLVEIKNRKTVSSSFTSSTTVQNPEKGNTNQVLLLKWGPEQRCGHYDGSEIRKSPVEVGNLSRLSPLFGRFYHHPRWLFRISEPECTNRESFGGATGIVLGGTWIRTDE